MEPLDVQKIIHARMTEMMRELHGDELPSFVLLVPETGMLVTSLEPNMAAIAMSNCVTSLLAINYKATVTSEEDEDGNVEAKIVGMN
jgi:hypothetical protein